MDEKKKAKVRQVKGRESFVGYAKHVDRFNEKA